MRIIPTSLVLLTVAAAPARADEAPPPPFEVASVPAAATVLHVPPIESRPDQPLELVAVIDGPWREREIVARWRNRDAVAWTETPFQQSSAGGWYATIPADAVGKHGIDYYIVGRGKPGETLHFASETAPHTVAVVPSAIEQLADTDRARAGGRTEIVSFDIDTQDFGNRFDSGTSRKRDRYLRTEVKWTHRMFRALYATSFGFGAIEGITPADATPVSLEELTQARYGFGEVRLRVHPAVFLDARLALGISHEGFIPGAAASVIVGRPWGSNISFGGELLSDMGASGFVRLQWDTAPPLLMGASIIRTDLPGANLPDSPGVLIRYDLSYRMAGRFTTRAALSLGARDGSAHLGGGLGAGYEF